MMQWIIINLNQNNRSVVAHRYSALWAHADWPMLLPPGWLAGWLAGTQNTGEHSGEWEDDKWKGPQ